MLPFKKKNPERGKVCVRAQGLLSGQMEFNKMFVYERVVVEHANSRVKSFGCLEMSLGIASNAVMS